MIKVYHSYPTRLLPKKSFRLLFLCLFTFSVFLFAHSKIFAQSTSNNCLALGNKIFVDSGQSVSGDGTSWNAALAYLSDALNLADSCPSMDSILIAKGTYYPTGIQNSSQSDSNFTIIRGNLTLLGGFDGQTGLRDWHQNPTIIEGDIGLPNDATDNSHHLMVIATNQMSNPVKLDGIIFQGGYNHDSIPDKLYNSLLVKGNQGAGLYITNSRVEITNCRFQENEARKGGGLFSENSLVKINGVQFFNNQAFQGGGFFAQTNTQMDIQQTEWKGNTASAGAAIYSSNSGGSHISNSLFSGNNATQFASVLFYDGNDSLIIANSTLAGNKTNFLGGSSIYINTTTAPQVALYNSIIWGNSSSITGTLTVSNSIIQNGNNGGTNLDPNFQTPIPANDAPNILGDYHLTGCSPAINTGDDGLLPSNLTEDLDQQSRIIGAFIDLGAFEYPDNFSTNHVLYVDSSVAQSGDGSSWSNAYKTLKEAFDEAAKCQQIDSILVAEGTYYPTGTQQSTDRDEFFGIPRNGLAILGGFNSQTGVRDFITNETILSGDIGTPNNDSDNSFHLLVVAGLDAPGDSVIFDGFTLMKTNANANGNINFNGKAITQNKGGAIYFASSNNPKIRISNSRLIFHQAINGGAAIYVSNSGPTLHNLVISGNSSTSSGGAIYNFQANPVFINNLITGNFSNNNGGAIYNSNNSTAQFINTTISANLSDQNTGGIYNTASATVQLQNSIVFGNSGNGLMGGIQSREYSLVQGFNGGNNGNLDGNLDPLFTQPEPANTAPTTAGDYRLIPCSPVIDMGNNSLIPIFASNDLDLTTRLVGPAVDLGAYEFPHSIANYLHDTDHITLCFGDSFLAPNQQTYVTNGVFTDTFLLANGCDSFHSYHLTFMPQPINLPTLILDSCEQIIFKGLTFTTDTAFADTIRYQFNACDSAFQEIIIQIHHPQITDLTESICATDTFYLGNMAYTSSGSYQQIYTDIHGCDSILNLSLTVNPTITTYLSDTICPGDTYILGTHQYSATGDYVDTFLSNTLCDSIVNLHLEVLPYIMGVDTISLCAGQNYVFGGQTITQAGNYTDTFPTSNCDSIATLVVFLNPSIVTDTSFTICAQDLPFSFGSQTLTSAGSYTETFVSQTGCDSTVQLQLTVNDTYDIQDSVWVCAANLPYAFGSQSLSQTGIYNEVFISQAGCDSNVQLSFIVLPDTVVTDSVSICFQDLPFSWGNQTITATGLYLGNFTNIAGCDSIVHLYVKVGQAPATINIDTGACQELLFEGNTYTQNQILHDTFLNQMGCDSVYRLVQIQIWGNSPTTDTVLLSDCHEVFFEGQLYQHDTVLQTIFVNSQGCDSLIRWTFIEIHAPYSDTIEVEICRGDSYDWLGMQLDSAGFYTHNFIATNGCDSLITLKLTVQEKPDLAAEIYPNQTTFCIGDEIEIIGVGANHFNWYDEKTGKNLSQFSSLKLVLNEAYTGLWMEGASRIGCADTLKIELEAEHCCTIFVPNAFTPNGDGMNDKFGVETIGNPTEFSIEIFDRYGVRIFHSIRVKDKWDGRQKGLPAATGTYFYHITGTCTDGSKFKKRGSLVLIR